MMKLKIGENIQIFSGGSIGEDISMKTWYGKITKVYEYGFRAVLTERTNENVDGILTRETGFHREVLYKVDREHEDGSVTYSHHEFGSITVKPEPKKAVRKSRLGNYNYNNYQFAS